ncbi:hypothetical protein KY285_007706 [Solanum tuberosum]|nr:hypothetical protein KY285_007706 [Solanum tuberosum]
MSREGTRLTAGGSVLQQFTQKISKFQNLNGTSVPRRKIGNKSNVSKPLVEHEKIKLALEVMTSSIANMDTEIVCLKAQLLKA